jgi:CelD/BcsL family acetyltransferase involved in cellulose biosynthesis
VPLVVREHTTGQEFRQLEPVWNDLVRSAPLPTLYLSFEWLWTWWECFGGGRRRLRILSVSEGESTVAIAPFMQVRRLFLGIPYHTIEFISARDYAFSHLTMSGLLDIIAPSRTEEVIDALLRHLLSPGGRWTYMRLEPLAEEGVTRSLLAKRAPAFGLRVREGGKFEAYEVRLSKGWEDRRMKGEQRHADPSRGIEEKLRRQGQLIWEDTDASDAHGSLFETILGVEQRSWKWKRGLSIIALGYAGFYPAFLSAAAACRSLRVTLLRIDGRAVAYVFSALFGGTLEALKTAYDASFARFSPGRLALWHHVRHAASEGVESVNLHIGSREYKSEWATGSRMYTEVFLLRGTARGRLLGFFLFTLGLYGRFRFVPDLTKRLLRRLGFTPRWSELTRTDQV